MNRAVKITLLAAAGAVALWSTAMMGRGPGSSVSSRHAMAYGTIPADIVMRARVLGSEDGQDGTDRLDSLSDAMRAGTIGDGCRRASRLFAPQLSCKLAEVDDPAPPRIDGADATPMAQLGIMSQFAQAMIPPPNLPQGAVPGAMLAQFGPPPIFGLPGAAGIPGQPGMASPPLPPPAPRLICEEAIHRIAAMTAYLHSKLRLQGDQEVAWLKIGQAAEPSLQKLRDLCGQLPSQPTPPPNFPDLVDFSEQHLTVRLALLQAVREPLRAFYQTLSPDQRSVMPPVPPLPPLPFPPGGMP